MSSYPRGSKLIRHGCRVKFCDFRTNRSRDIRAAHIVMDAERRRRTKVVNTYDRTSFDVLPENTAAYSSLLPTQWATSDRQSMILVFLTVGYNS